MLQSKLQRVTHDVARNLIVIRRALENASNQVRFPFAGTRLAWQDYAGMILFFIAAFVLSAIITAGEAFYERRFPSQTFPFFALFLVLLVIAADIFH